MRGKIRKWIMYCCIVIFSFIFFFAAYKIVSYFTVSNMEQNELSDLKQTLQTEETEKEPITENNSDDLVDVSALVQQNDDCIGWISIPDTNIDYPVMHTPDDPEYYLRRNFKGKYSAMGVPFMDYRCKLNGDHLIVYGHNMLNGTMFSNLKYFLKESYRSAHPEIYFDTVEGRSVYEITLVKRVSNVDEWYRNLHPSDGKKYLTLSTCYGDEEDRLIIVSVKKE